ncbi:MAG: ribosomal RNA adenine dimethylase domain-containing protein [Candidatus Hydrogenedens sp.]|nr:ribosomal RNA adenine dimethylase domain-containing protein [Candidatus Hydrogenedens sp.]
MSTLTFMKEVILKNKTTGALGPSSRELAATITSLAGLSTSQIIVEYGSGDGVFTEEIQRQKKKDALFVAMEVNETLVQATRERCPDVTVIHDGAQNVRHHLESLGHDYCDTIISGLPWTRFDDRLQDEILEATWDILCPGGRFLTFAYTFSPLFPAGRRFFQDKLLQRFPNTERTEAIWKNIPPCHVYIAHKAVEK